MTSFMEIYIVYTYHDHIAMEYGVACSYSGRCSAYMHLWERCAYSYIWKLGSHVIILCNVHQHANTVV